LTADALGCVRNLARTGTPKAQPPALTANDRETARMLKVGSLAAGCALS
jgi:hypothetical protein